MVNLNNYYIFRLNKSRQIWEISKSRKNHQKKPGDWLWKSKKRESPGCFQVWPTRQELTQPLFEEKTEMEELI